MSTSTSTSQSLLSEEAVLEHWKKIDAFQTQNKIAAENNWPIFTFYDGPPFATGLPHFGHILAGSIKDTVTRYAWQTGHQVTRRFGWDCHGLPIEYEIDKQYGIKSQSEIPGLVDPETGKTGVACYNHYCRSIVTRYTGEWEKVITRLGRWIDFKNDYKTMDPDFMESVWNVFSQLYDKGAVYRGYRVMPYSTACATPLSNFETSQNYKTKQDPSIVITFPVIGEENTEFLAWTTTPWTLPSNLALCVNPDFTYVKIRDNTTQKCYYLLKSRLDFVYHLSSKKKKTTKKKKKKNKKRKSQSVSTEVSPSEASSSQNSQDQTPFTILSECKGTDLVGKSYVPIFPYFQNYKQTVNAFRVLSDGFVGNDAGTGIVHCAPAFGEDDYRVCTDAKIVTEKVPPLMPLDPNCRFLDSVVEYKGTTVTDTKLQTAIIARLKSEGRCFWARTEEHEYPFCWRSDTPLIYRALPCWFIRVTNIRDRLLQANDQTYWVPEHVRERRFRNWLANARDWCVSRNRFWGTPIPIWMSEDGKEKICIKSVAHLAELSGVTVTDLHRENVDHIEIKSPTRPGVVLRRIPEVFDCWFESGSMPYAQQHYPFAFKNPDDFQKLFPADFIAEGIDQTRGWFYTLMVLSTLLFDKPPFKNLVVNGLVLAQDGKKMSKRLKNYPDPMNVVNECGADALRVFLINSPVVRGEDLRFSFEGVRHVVSELILPWKRSLDMLKISISSLENRLSKKFSPSPLGTSDNLFDKWITAHTSHLIRNVHSHMKGYFLYKVIPPLLNHFTELTNWYIRFNRNRLKKSSSPTCDADELSDCQLAVSTLYNTLLTLTQLVSFVMPFTSETSYQFLKQWLPDGETLESVHFGLLPTHDPSLSNDALEESFEHFRNVVLTVRNLRAKSKISTSTQLQKVIVSDPRPGVEQALNIFSEYIKSECSVNEIIFDPDQSKFASFSIFPNHAKLGSKFQKNYAPIRTWIFSNSKSVESVAQAQTGTLKVPFSGSAPDGYVVENGYLLLTGDDFSFRTAITANPDEYTGGCASNMMTLVLLNLTITPNLVAQSTARKFAASVQKLRSEHNFVLSDQIDCYYAMSEGSDPQLWDSLFETHSDLIKSRIKCSPLPKPTEALDTELYPGTFVAQSFDCTDGSKIEYPPILIWIAKKSTS